MNKKTKIGKCVYCGLEKEVTDDHVISRNLFPKSHKKKNVIIAPSCWKCNNGFSKDEEYFRNFVLGLTVGYSQNANALFSTKMMRSLNRRPPIAYKTMNQIEAIHLYTNNGKYMGVKRRIHLTEDDWKRYFNVLNKYIKGLFVHEFETVLSSDYRIMHRLGSKRMLGHFGYITKWNKDNKDIFIYGYNREKDTPRSFWITTFYDTVFFESFILPEKESEYFKNQHLPLEI